MILKSKKNNEKIKNSWQIAKWLWTISKSLRTQSAINAIASILVVALDFAFIAATKQTIDIATGKNAHTMTFATICLITVIVLQILIGFSRRWIGALLGVKSQNRMQQRIFSRLLRSEWNGRETRHSGDILNRLERDVRDVTTVITDTLPSALGVGVRFVGAFIFLFSMDSKLACLIVCILPLFILMSRMYVHKMRELNRAIRNTDSKVQSILTESIQHRMILKTLERIGTMTNHLEETQTLLRQQIRHSTKFSSISATLTRIGFATGYSVTFLWGAHRLQDGTITYGMMLAFIQLVGQIQGPFRDMTKFIPTIIGAFTASERLMELEDVPVEEEGAPVRFNQSVGIQMKHVSYTYPSGTRHILEDFSYDFPPGSSTAIVGETGAGKTTMIRLILSLLHPQTGSVEMYNNEKTVTTSPLTRCNIVYVPQGNTLFSGTIRYNLLLGNPDATEEEMKQALHLACADFVLSLPDGLDSRCGEMGTGLSEGQAQRIAIARALLKRGGILLLDEATSALDTQTEKSLLENLNQWIDGNRTLLFVTHRPAVLAHCDQVLHLSRQQ